MSWSEDLDRIVDDYSSALDAFRRAFNERDLPGHLSNVRREAKGRNRPTHLILISHFRSEWIKKYPDTHEYLERIHRRMGIVAKKYDQDTYTDRLIRQALIDSDLEDEITLRDRTYQRRMRERCQFVVRSLVEVLEYTETPAPDEMRNFLRENDTPSRGPERGKY